MMRSIFSALIGAAVVSSVLAVPLEAQGRAANNPFIGVWQVNIERSVYPGPRPPADLVTLYQFAPMPDGSTRFTLTSMNGAGDLTMQVSVFRIDGRQYKVHNFDTVAGLLSSGGDTNVTRSYRQVDANTVEFTGYTDGVANNPVLRQLQPGGNAYVQRPATGEGSVLYLERIR